MNWDRFGIFVRSVGERTEGLCLAACLPGLRQENIHLIRGVYPASRAYAQMFAQAQTYGYSWYLGLDADVVLDQHWWLRVQQTLQKIQDKDFFVFSFSVQDYFLGKIDRGNHFYNGYYTRQALHTLTTRTAHSSKPESHLEKYIEARAECLPGLIGHHGYEQYYRDIYYRFWMQYKRNPRAVSNSAIFHGKGLDGQVAKRAWERSRQQRLANFLHRFRYRVVTPNKHAGSVVWKNFHRLRIQEKKPLTLSLNEFYAQRRTG